MCMRLAAEDKLFCLIGCSLTDILRLFLRGTPTGDVEYDILLSRELQ